MPESEKPHSELSDCQAELNRYRTWTPPGHFYSPIPDVASLQLREKEIFRVPRRIPGIDFREQEQLKLLDEFRTFYREQPFTAERRDGRRYHFENPNYSYADALFLYSMMRRVRPSRIVEVGSGYSSCAILDVNEFFFDNSISCTFIDPYPDLLYQLLSQNDLDRAVVLAEAVQDAGAAPFLRLEENDFLLIDSTHVAKTGSDVNYIFFELLPLLNAGVYIHIHDVFYPFEYPKEWIYEGRAWNENYLLRAFLMYNTAFRIEFFSKFLIEFHSEFFNRNMPLCLRNTGGCIWLKKTSDAAAVDRDAAAGRTSGRALPRRIDLAGPCDARQLGYGWYEPEHGHRWMSGRAQVRLGGPVANGDRLWIEASNPIGRDVVLNVRMNGRRIGTATVAGGALNRGFDIPPEYVGSGSVQVGLELSHTSRAGDDSRELGLSFGAIEIR